MVSRIVVLSSHVVACLLCQLFWAQSVYGIRLADNETKEETKCCSKKKNGFRDKCAEEKGKGKAGMMGASDAEKCDDVAFDGPPDDCEKYFVMEENGWGKRCTHRSDSSDKTKCTGEGIDHICCKEAETKSDCHEELKE